MAEIKKEEKKEDNTSLEKFGFEKEVWEIARFAKPVETGFPKSVATYHFINESFTLSIEETYFWLLNYIQTDEGFYEAHKITDLFAAAEQSSLWGTISQRLSYQEDRVSNYLAVISKQIKELFQIVRELRIIDERLNYYDLSAKGHLAAEIALKGIWIDMVEGASKNPSSVYGLAQQVGFATLPDLFYATFPKSKEDVDAVVDKLEFNKKVKEVLKRKLFSFLLWKEETYKELKARKSFQLKFLRQFYDVMKLYMSWIKPHLRHVKRLMAKEKLKEEAVIAAFETTAIEIETLLRQPQPNKQFHPCVLINLKYTTKPSLGYQQVESYQRGPIHVGRVDVWIHAYAWSDEELENYKKYKNEEDLDLLKSVSASVEAAMDALGDDLKRYLKEAGEEIEEPIKEEEKIKLPTILDPFISVVKGFGELGSVFGFRIPEKKKGPSKWELDKQRKDAENNAKKVAWRTYKNYKKAHKMIAW